MSVKHTLSGTVLLALLAAEGAAHAQAQPLPATGGPSISQLAATQRAGSGAQGNAS